MDAIQVLACCRFDPGKFLPTLLYKTPGVRAFLLCLEPGQRLPARRDSEEILCYLIDGSAGFARGDTVVHLRAGDLIGAGPGEVRGLEARERTIALWIHITAERSDRPGPGDGTEGTDPVG